jgi:class 3 adenylate cyclase
VIGRTEPADLYWPHVTDTEEHQLPDVPELPGGEVEPLDPTAPGVGPASRIRDTAIRLDSQPGLLAAARRLRQRLPGDDKFGDPLSTAGATPVEAVARGVSALRPERESLLQELGLAGLQVWQSLSEAAGRGRGEQPLALLFTDLVGFSSWALKAGDGATLKLLREVGSAEEAAILANRGEIVKRLGDGLMASFLAVQDAVEAALYAHELVALVEVDGYVPRMRAGVHYGRPRRLGGDLLGVDVNIAARVADAAKPGDLLVSDAAAELLDIEGLRVGRARRLRADGAPRDMQVLRVSRA